jgi:5-methylcytosine-specific restriction endonuclease McrA
MNKICTKCGVEKSIDLFYKKGNQCKECIKKSCRDHYKNKIATNPDFVINEKKRLDDYRNSTIGKIKVKESKDKYARSEKRREYIRKWEYNKMNTDITHKVHMYFGHQIRERIKTKKKGKKTFELVGYTIHDLKKHLESQFGNIYSWDTYGNWEIDHVIPTSLYDFNNKDNIKKCWDLSNLRPLSRKENASKSNKLLIEEIENRNLWHLLPDELWLV